MFEKKITITNYTNLTNALRQKVIIISSIRSISVREKEKRSRITLIQRICPARKSVASSVQSVFEKRSMRNAKAIEASLISLPFVKFVDQERRSVASLILLILSICGFRYQELVNLRIAANFVCLRYSCSKKHKKRKKLISLSSYCSLSQ